MITVKVDDLALSDLNLGSKMEAIAAIVQSEPASSQSVLLEGAKLFILQSLQESASMHQADAATAYSAIDNIEAVDTSLKPA